MFKKRKTTNKDSLTKETACMKFCNTTVKGSAGPELHHYSTATESLNAVLKLWFDYRIVRTRAGFFITNGNFSCLGVSREDPSWYDMILGLGNDSRA